VAVGVTVLFPSAKRNLLWLAIVLYAKNLFVVDIDCQNNTSANNLLNIEK
jgi:hypothetical protein